MADSANDPQQAPAAAHRLRSRLFHILHKPSPGNPIARRVNYGLAALIVLNATAVALESIPELGAAHRPTFFAFEVFSTSIFVVEYLARLWVCVEQAHLAHPVLGRLRYALQPLPLLDLVVIATAPLPVDLRFLRVGRMVRLLRVLRLDEFEQALSRIGASLRRRRELLIVAVTLMVLCVYVSAALLYQIEHAAQPAVFRSIPDTFWWAIVTLATIGYGDMVPLTPLGKLCAGLISLFGVGVFALPSAIVTAAIIEAGSEDAARR
jgi:voltage-gated potassium channel